MGASYSPSSRRKPFSRRTVLILLLCTIVILFFLANSDSSYNLLPLSLNLFHRSSRSYFHLLVPTTTADLNLCRLLYSAAVLNYPTPILVGWNATGEYDISTSSIAKITGTIRYLESLPPERNDDLVLIVDGSDVWLQLRPDVLISRYFDVNAAAEERLAEDFGEGVMELENIRQTILFGPDKFCWPADYNRPACWAIPQSTVGKWALGPHTDSGGSMNRARWLNSGTIMGNVKDLLELFKGTMVMMSREYDEEAEDVVRQSDQMYLADLWGTQEWVRTEIWRNLTDIWGRRELFNENRQPPPPNGDATYPEWEDGQKTEFHIGVDYESAVFQTAAGYEAWLGWTHYDYYNPITKTLSSSKKSKSSNKRRIKSTAGKFYLPDDIGNSPAPFPAGFRPQDATRSDKQASGKELQTWSGLPLGTNMATKQIFAVFHFTVTGGKDMIDWWWSRMWYVPYGMELLYAAVRETNRERKPITRGRIDGRVWWNAEGEDEVQKPWTQKGGVWSDMGAWLGWEDMCQIHEEEMFA
ncbi:hypothetical protein NA57DRAFT_78989 [Rhizodiscina lignyota]|uniref:Uncharacterized protein n=1 Tax=Rhizodiscina lignyota TaxID=1504668 RepID=A0A9P4M308_9PEZI|nr:hypothetical protein NA57DRAFT_78989 [Rhizodiscina lignyota]